jgi:sugar phosphate isomerase/epimerase
MVMSHHMSHHLLAMAANVLPEFPPEVRVAAAAEAGYRAVGLWFDAAEWSDATTERVASALREGGAAPLVPLDIEVVRIRDGSVVPDAARRLIAVGGELGVRNVLIVSENPDEVETQRQFATLCELAHAAGMRAVLEFLMITSVRSLAAALRIVETVDHPAGGVLIDPLHLQRCGDRPADLRSVHPELLPYAQFCDGPATIVGSDEAAYRADAVDGRSSPGEGALPLVELLEVLPPAIPLSLEVRSRRYREQFPDPVDRAREVRLRTERFLAGASARTV